jgi:glycosyltransferase involved in cell wall biosynthesis
MSFHEKLKQDSKLYWHIREWYVVFILFWKKFFDRPRKQKKRILFYYVYALAYGGTSSLMQILAKYLNKDEYEVFVMYSNKVESTVGQSIPGNSRLQYVLESGVFPIPFDYSYIDKRLPYFIHNTSPRIEGVIKAFQIDLLVVTGAGHAEYPFSQIKNIPIILLNIFGQANVQSNIKYHLCISEEVANKLEPIVPKEKVKVIYVPSEGPMNMALQGQQIRERFGIKPEDLVFGRIGRGSDWIFDPIGILAFEKIVKKYPHTHYLIVCPPPALVKLQTEKNIPNVHFMEELGKKEELWAFYYALDVYAHFRHDGESFGLNIVEAMFKGMPIISHKSKIWNAHLEYLDSSFAFVADVDNIDQYAEGMEFFAKDTNRVQIKIMGEKAKAKAEKFHIKNHIGAFEGYIQEALK